MIYSITLDYGAGPKKIMEYQPGVESDDMNMPLGAVLSQLLQFCQNGIVIEVMPTSRGN
jgi:hypothetical protein